MQQDVPSYIHDTIYALYCGEVYTGNFSPTLEFIDPLVRVHAAPPTLRMFRRLNALFPHTTIMKLLPLSQVGQQTVFDFEVVYKRHPSHKGQMMRSTLTVIGNGQEVTHIKEDWRVPLTLSAEALTLLHPIRRVLGRLCGL